MIIEVAKSPNICLKALGSASMVMQAYNPNYLQS